jgi:HK97 family phage portal protein
VEDPTQPLTSSTILDWLGRGWESDAGVAVTPDTAMRLTAVYRSVALLGGTVGSLPLHTFNEDTHKRTSHDIIKEPHPDLTPMELWEWSMAARLLRGNAYFRKIRTGAGRIVQLWPIHPGRVRVGRAKVTSENPSGKYFAIRRDEQIDVYDDDLEDREIYTPHEILHLPALSTDGLVGLSPIQAARQAIGLGLAAETFGAKFFGKGALMSGVLQTEMKLNDKDAEFVQKLWQKRLGGGLEKAHEVAVLSHGAKFAPITLPQRDAQFIETRKFQVAEIARLYGIPPVLLMDVERSTSWGTGIEQQNIGMVVWTLRPWLVRTEQRIEKELLPANERAEFKVEGLLRGDTKSRGEFYAKGRQWGWWSADDIRAFENESPIPGGDQYLTPSNMNVVGAEQTEGEDQV